ncbi:MAG: excinuclease ABC subunit UvrA [Gemmataceae bacterium]|nr:excinuclease ABC subunit UvrA [Gemmataceae bacterium]
MAHVSTISLRGVRVHNLQGIDVDIPIGKLTAVTGVSGAGKSSLVFDTLFAEAQRRYLQSFSVGIRQQLERFDRPDADSIGDLPPAIAVRQRRGGGPAGRATVGSLTELDSWLRLLVARGGTVHCPRCQQAVRPATVEDVRAAIDGLPPGQRVTVAFPSRPDPDQDVAAWTAALLEEGFVRVHIDGRLIRLDEAAVPELKEDSDAFVVLDRIETGAVNVERLRDSVETAFSRGQGRLVLLTENATVAQAFDRRWRCPGCDVPVPEPNRRLLDCDDPLGACPTCRGTGIASSAVQRGKRIHGAAPCPACNGRRWNDQALTVRLHGKNIAELSSFTLDELAQFVDMVAAAPTSRAARDQLQRRLTFLRDVELGYLTLLRPDKSLGAGERIRLQLCAALANNLVGALYLLEEPSSGSHPRDAAKIIAPLRRLCGTGSTVVMIEHHEEFIRAADHVIDLGPGAGEEGGRVAAQGPVETIMAAADSATGEYLHGDSDTPPSQRRRPQQWLHLRNVRLHNLQDVSVDIPLGVLCAVTGVGGAGKRSLIQHALYPCLALAKQHKQRPEAPAGATVQGAGQVADVVLIDQEPLPRTARSNAATYLKIFDDIRALFAAAAEAKIRGFGPGHFSFNQPGGRCDACEGQGTLTVDMQFLADVAMTCPECHGTRFKHDILNVKVRSLSIAEVLDLTVREAFRFFRAQRGIEARLKWLLDVGLEYLRLGQPTETLSGGESQRLKLAGHLASSRKPRGLFILVEPTAGLHPADIDRLLGCLDGLVQAGHSIVCLDNHRRLVQNADYVIALGPGAGKHGGRIVAQGTPEEAGTDGQ